MISKQPKGEWIYHEPYGGQQSTIVVAETPVLKKSRTEVGSAVSESQHYRVLNFVENRQKKTVVVFPFAKILNAEADCINGNTELVVSPRPQYQNGQKVDFFPEHQSTQLKAAFQEFLASPDSINPIVYNIPIGYVADGTVKQMTFLSKAKGTKKAQVRVFGFQVEEKVVFKSKVVLETPSSSQ